MARDRKRKKPIVYTLDEAFIFSLESPGFVQIGSEFEIDAEGNFSIGNAQRIPIIIEEQLVDTHGSDYDPERATPIGEPKTIRDFDRHVDEIERRADEKLSELGWPAVYTNALKERREAAKRGKNPLAGPHYRRLQKLTEMAERGSVFGHLRAIKITLLWIRDYQARREDISPLAYELGWHVRAARIYDDFRDKQAAKGTLPRKPTEERKAEALRAFEECRKPCGNRTNPQQDRML